MIMLDKLLYIDPGTGSMLFSIIIGIAGVLIFAGHALIIKLKFFFLGGICETIGQAFYMAVMFSDFSAGMVIISAYCAISGAAQRCIA